MPDYIYINKTGNKAGAIRWAVETDILNAGKPNLRMEQLQKSGSWAEVDLSNPVSEPTTRAFTIRPTDWRKSAALKDVLDDAAGTSLLGLADAQGSYVVGSSTNNTSVTEKAACYVVLPSNYQAAGDLTLRLRGSVSVARTVAATVDAVVKKVGDAALGSDIVETAAQSINSTTAANRDFVITPTGLAAGDVLLVEITIANNDTGGASGGLATLHKAELRAECDY
jgi:hypothetical protein